MNFDLREQLIAQELTARSLAGLFEFLLRLKGYALNQDFTLRWLYAVGGQSILYLAEGSSGRKAIVKMAFLPYQRAAYMNAEDIYQARQRLVREANLLQGIHSNVLPEFYELIYAVNPLLSPARGKKIVNSEPYLVMEYIQGETLLEIAKLIHRGSHPNYDALEWLVWQVAITTIDFSVQICNREKPYLYSDFTPQNVIITGNHDRLVRLLDAGSLIPIQSEATVLPPFTWAYIPPEYFQQYEKGKSLWPNPRYVMYTLGKVLWEVLTNKSPIPGNNPNLFEPKLKKYSMALQNLIADLIIERNVSFEQLKQLIESKFMLKQELRAKATTLSDSSNIVLKENITSLKAVPIVQASRSSIVVHLLKKRQIHPGTVQVLRYSPEGDYLAVANRTKVELWNAHTLRLERHFKSPHSTPVVDLDFDSTSRYLASGSQEGMICLWHISHNNAIWQYRDRKFYGLIGLDAQGDFLAAVTKWRIVTFHPQRAIQTGSEFEGVVDQCMCIAINKKQALLAVGGLWGIRLWNIQTTKALGILRLDQNLHVEQLSFCGEDQTLAALISDNETMRQWFIIIWDILNNNIIGKVEIFTRSDIKLVAKDQLICVGSSDGNIWIWNKEQMLDYTQITSCGRISSLDLAPDKQTLAIATFDGEVKIYQLTYA